MFLHPFLQGSSRPVLRLHRPFARSTFLRFGGRFARIPPLLAAMMGLAMAARAAMAPIPAAEDAALVRAHGLYAAGDRAGGRGEYARLAADTNAPVIVRSLARLGLARAWQLEEDWDSARAEYERELRLAGAPVHHVEEAEAGLREIARARAGTPPREPGAGRTPPEPFPNSEFVRHVAPTGSDLAAGTAEHPFATLERARDEVRKARRDGRLPAEGAVVIVHGGTYPVTRTLELAAEDSGTARGPIVYRRAPGETPVFTGGVRLKGFAPVTDAAVRQRLPEEVRGRVRQVDLKQLGVTNVAPVRLGGFASGAGFRSHPATELFFDGTALPLARWPNEGFARIVEARGATPVTEHGAGGTREGLFSYEGERPARWRDDPDPVLYGYWFFGWADSYERVARIDPARHEIELAPPYHSYGYRRGQPYVAMNLLSEIDQPGEWYLDRRTLTLYVDPPSDPARAVVELSLLPVPFVALDQVSHVAFEGLTWELGGTDVIRSRGGEGCLIAGCTIRRCGGNAIEFDGGTRHGVRSCDLFSLGRGGVVLTGGDRRTLAPGRHYVENCHIRELSRLDRTYTPAVLLNGAGNRLSHNLLHDIRSSALRIEGNEQVIEYNEIARVVLESDDQGGVDMFGNPTYRGNRYQYNYFHHIGCWRNPAAEPECGQAGIRLDDMISGTLILGNVFQRCASGRLGFGGVQIHGGKDNILDNNLFLDCASAVSFSPWGEKSWRERSAGAFDPATVDRALYLARYPELARFDQDLNVNHLWRNLVVNCGEFLRRDARGARLLGNCVATNVPAFPTSAEGLIQLDRARTLLDRAGFRPIPLADIGLYRDSYRETLPAELLARIRDDRQ